MKAKEQTTREKLEAILQQANSRGSQEANRAICRRFYVALAATPPLRRVPPYRWGRSRYAYLVGLSKLKLALMKDNWYEICAAMQDMVHFYPVTFAPIRSMLLSALEEKEQEGLYHDVD